MVLTEIEKPEQLFVNQIAFEQTLYKSAHHKKGYNITKGRLIAKLISSIQSREKSPDLKEKTLRELSFYRDRRSLTRFVAQLQTNPLSPRRPFIDRLLSHSK